MKSNHKIYLERPTLSYTREYCKILTKIVRRWTTYKVVQNTLLWFQTSISILLSVLWCGKRMEIELKTRFELSTIDFTFELRTNFAKRRQFHVELSK